MTTSSINTMQISAVDADRMSEDWRPHFSFTTTINLADGQTVITRDTWVLVEDRDPRQGPRSRKVASRPGQLPGWVVSIDTREELESQLAKIREIAAKGVQPI